MMKQEFEALAGYEVSFEDYTNIIEPMYMAVNANKQDFVQMIDKKRFALKTKNQIIAEMKKLAKHLRETCEHYTDHDAQDKLNALLDEYKKRFWVDCYIANRTTGDDYGCHGRGCSYPDALVCVTPNWSTDARHAGEIERIALTTR